MTWLNDGKRHTIIRRVCANCRQISFEGDRYCRFCGAPMRKLEFIEEEIALIYGPQSMERLQKCGKCGYERKIREMINKER